jgi:hypothetical protein
VSRRPQVLRSGLIPSGHQGLLLGAQPGLDQPHAIVLTMDPELRLRRHWRHPVRVLRLVRRVWRWHRQQVARQRRFELTAAWLHAWRPDLQVLWDMREDGSAIGRPWEVFEDRKLDLARQLRAEAFAMPVLRQGKSRLTITDVS